PDNRSVEQENSAGISLTEPDSGNDADGEERTVGTVALDHRLAGLEALRRELLGGRDVGLAVGDRVLFADVKARLAEGFAVVVHIPTSHLDADRLLPVVTVDVLLVVVHRTEERSPGTEDPPEFAEGLVWVGCVVESLHREG